MCAYACVSSCVCMRTWLDICKYLAMHLATVVCMRKVVPTNKLFAFFLFVLLTTFVFELGNANRNIVEIKN